MTPDNIELLLYVIICLGSTIGGWAYLLISKWIDKKYDK